jgi:hypothetical protein
MAYQVIYQNCLPKYKNWLLGFTFLAILEVKSIIIEVINMALEDLSKGCKIDPSNIHIGVHLKKLWVFGFFDTQW